MEASDYWILTISFEKVGVWGPNWPPVDDLFGFPVHSKVYCIMKEELDVKSPVACAKFTLNQITKAYWCLTVWAGVQTPRQYPRETRKHCSPFMHSYLLIWLTLSSAESLIHWKSNNTLPKCPFYAYLLSQSLSYWEIRWGIITTVHVIVDFGWTVKLTPLQIVSLHNRSAQCFCLSCSLSSYSKSRLIEGRVTAAAISTHLHVRDRLLG